MAKKTPEMGIKVGGSAGRLVDKSTAPYLLSAEWYNEY